MLHQFIDEPTSALLQEYRAFFAFSRQQFEDQKEQGVDYVRLGAGMCCPKAQADAFLVKWEAITAQGVAQVLAQHTRAEIIEHELMFLVAPPARFGPGRIDDLPP